MFYFIYLLFIIIIFTYFQIILSIGWEDDEIIIREREREKKEKKIWKGKITKNETKENFLRERVKKNIERISRRKREFNFK